MQFAVERSFGSMLQRGRTLKSAESGAMTCLLCDYEMASTGPHSEECGEAATFKFLNEGAEASTGPHSEECGEPARRSALTCCTTGFNGAAL